MNKEAYNDFWYWINMRQHVYLKKQEGAPKPWSPDPIFQEWKFCNVFRTQDTETKFLTDRILGNLNPDYDQASTAIFLIFLFRAFNRYETYEYLMYNQEATSIRHFPMDFWRSKLQKLDNNSRQIISGAYMIRGREGMPKYESILMTLEQIFDVRETIAADILSSGHSMEKAYKYLSSYNFWGWGPFTLYQVLLDLTYTPMLEHPGDINNWTIFGPGAARGLREIWPGLPKSDFLSAAKRLTAEQEYHLDPVIFKEPMTLQDIEFCLCELGKYRRIKNGGKGKERYDGK